MCSTVYMCSKSDRQHFVMALFHYSGTKDSVLDPQNPRSQAVKCVMAERGVQKTEGRLKDNGTSISCSTQKSLKEGHVSRHSKTDQHRCHSHIGIVAVLQHWPSKMSLQMWQPITQPRKTDPTNPSTVSFQHPQSDPCWVSWVWLVRLASNARIDTETKKIHCTFPKFKLPITSSVIKNILSCYEI